MFCIRTVLTTCFVLTIPAMTNATKFIKEDDLQGRIKVREVSQQSSHYSYDEHYIPTGFSPHYLHGQPIPHYEVLLSEPTPYYGGKGKGKDKDSKKAGIVQKLVNKGVKKLTEKLLGTPEPVIYQREIYQPAALPRYVEVKVPKCKHRLEIPTYITETLIKTSKYPVTKIVTKTTRVKVTEYKVNTKYHTLTETVTKHVPRYEPPQTVFKTVYHKNTEYVTVSGGGYSSPEVGYSSPNNYQAPVYQVFHEQKRHFDSNPNIGASTLAHFHSSNSGTQETGVNFEYALHAPTGVESTNGQVNYEEELRSLLLGGPTPALDHHLSGLLANVNGGGISSYSQLKRSAEISSGKLDRSEDQNKS